MISVVKLDWDTKNPFKLQKYLWKILQVMDWIDGITVKETRKGFHTYLYLNKELTDEQIFCLELLLETDEFKMAIDLKRLVKGYKFWNVLFTRKYKNGVWSCERDTARTKLLHKLIEENRSKFTITEKLHFIFNF